MSSDHIDDNILDKNMEEGHDNDQTLDQRGEGQQ